MADTIKIQLDTSIYTAPTEDEIKVAKNYVLRRNNTATQLESLTDALLADAAEKVTAICYRYNVQSHDFKISSEYNADMMDEISKVMDELEEAILDLIFDYSLRCTDDNDHKALLMAWMATLGRGNRNLKDTLEGYLYKTMKDWEAAIAALRYAKVGQTQAISIIKSNLHSTYLIPQVRAAFKHASEIAATYIKSGGIQPGGQGHSNNGSTNVVNMAKLTQQMAWMHGRQIDYEQSGAAGYYVLRGSLYPCKNICDTKVGFHNITDTDNFPPYHGHCCCFAVPIYAKTAEQITYESLI